MVNKKANVFCFPGKWDLLLLIKYFLSKTTRSSSTFPLFSHYFFLFFCLVTHRPSHFCLSFCFEISYTKASNRFLSIFHKCQCGPICWAHFHESTSSGTGSVNDSRGSWQNNYNPVGNAPLSVVSLASSLTNQIHCFSLLFKIALSVPGNSEHFLTDKSKVALPQKLPPRGNRWQQFSSFKSIIQELKDLVYLVNQLFWREKITIICFKCFAGKKLIKKMEPIQMVSV